MHLDYGSLMINMSLFMRKYECMAKAIIFHEFIFGK